VLTDGPTKILRFSLTEEGFQHSVETVDTRRAPFYSITFGIAQVGVSFVGGVVDTCTSSSNLMHRHDEVQSGEELLYVCLEGVQGAIVSTPLSEMSVTTTTASGEEECWQMDLRMKHFQIDDPRQNTLFPILLQPVSRQVKAQRLRLGTMGSPSSKKAVVGVHIRQRKGPHMDDISYFDLVSLAIAPLVIELDNSLLYSLLNLFSPLLVSGAANHNLSLDAIPETSFHDPSSLSLEHAIFPKTMELASTPRGRNRQMFCKLLEISNLELHLTMKLPTHWSPHAAQASSSHSNVERRRQVDDVAHHLPWFSTIAILNTEDIVLKFSSVCLENDLSHSSALMKKLSNHYVFQALKQLHVMLGGLEILGSPAEFVRTIGSGMRDFVLEPLEAFQNGEGMEDVTSGLARGMGSLISHTVEGITLASYKLTSSVSTGLAFLSFDDSYQQRRAEHMARMKRLPGLSKEAFLEGCHGFKYGVVEGVTGLIKQPWHDSQKDSVAVRGLAKGVAKGLIGVAVKPAVGLFDLASVTAEKCRHALRTHHVQSDWSDPSEDLLESAFENSVLDQMPVSDWVVEIRRRDPRGRTRLPRALQHNGLVTTYSPQEAEILFCLREVLPPCSIDPIVDYVLLTQWQVRFLICPHSIVSGCLFASSSFRRALFSFHPHPHPHPHPLTLTQGAGRRR
jgi:hypothetical protein